MGLYLIVSEISISDMESPALRAHIRFERERERERERETEGDRERERETEGDRERQREKCFYINTVNEFLDLLSLTFLI